MVATLTYRHLRAGVTFKDGLQLAAQDEKKSASREFAQEIAA